MRFPPFRVWLLLASLVLAIPPTSAQVAQRPLLGTVGSAAPNLVFTLDDSGSMWFECLPDSMCTLTDVNGGITRGVGTVPVDFAGNALKDSVASYDSYVRTDTVCVSFFFGFCLSYGTQDVNVSSPNLYGRQMRSSATNPLYYDPAVRYQPWLKADGTRYPNSPGTAALINPESATSGTVNLTTPYSVTTNWCSSLNTCTNETRKVVIAQYFRLTSGTGTALADFTSVVINSGTTSYTKASTRTDCAGSTCTYAEELQNFANWFSYFRNRARVAIGGTAESFATIPSTYRVGYGRINKTTATSIDGVNTATIERGVRPFTGTDRTDFYTWLFGRAVPSGGTPLRRAMDDVGQYYSRSDNAGPWGATPGTNDTTAQLTCRRSFHVLMTDGGWNGDAATTAAAQGNVDNTTGTAITGPNNQSYTYTPSRPFLDSTGNTLADVAMYYWARDLRPDLANGVTASTANPAFWQHMVNHTISFGIDGSLDNPNDLAALTSGTKTWPAPTNDATKVDDLWHAAVNSRGTAGSARNVSEYTAALQVAFSDIASTVNSEAGVSVSTRQLTSNTRKYVPTYDTTRWSGDLAALTVPASGDSVQVWQASSKVPAPASRNILAYNKAATGSPRAVPFTWVASGGLTDAMKTTLFGSTTGGEALTAYLRGDRTGEGSTYRTRTSVLGDIVNSSPAVVKDLVDEQYDFLPAGTPKTDYRRFVKAKAMRPTQVYVGANDGMLHAFSDADGTETFAFVPAAVLGSIKNLASTSYSHQYFVDGPVVEADVYDANYGSSRTNKWRNLLIAGGGAGAKNLFAINLPVPDFGTSAPTAYTLAQATPGASDILWEIDSTTTGFGEMGYLMQSPEVGVMRDGTWVVIFGNGYESASGKAQLFVVNALTGALVKRIDTGVGSTSDVNGLSGVRVVRDSFQRIVSAYAGDLKGNLWKFDFSSTSQSDWDVAFGGVAGTARNPLFVATNASSQREPITAAPTYALHPRGGVQVLVGTGKLFETNDASVTDQRTLYGVWDRVPVGSASTDATQRITDMSSTNIVSQTVSSTAISGTTGGTYYTVSSNTVDYGTKRGWRLPLTIATGQRLIYDPLISTGRVFFETLVPNAPGSCTTSSVGRYGFVLDPFLGGPGANGPTFDTNGDGLFTSADSATAGAVALGASARSSVVGTTDGSAKFGIISKDGTLTGKGATTTPRRYWRQILNPPQ
jgi:type IV pilus assembly protein PilY1